MKYLCLVYVDWKVLEQLSGPEFDALVSESLDYDDELRQRGYLIEAQALQPVETATTVRVRNNKLSTTDGPFAETKEQLGGFVFIEASDLNDALQIASKIPSAKLGTIEVRPIQPAPNAGPSAPGL
jgi:hypothetical protein